MYSINQVIKAANKAGVEFKDCGNGHIQLKGQLLVNYYPESSKCSAYVAGTRNRQTWVSPQKAIQMTKTPPTIKPNKKKRRNTKPIKKRLFKKIKNCRWCDDPLTLKTATLEHIIPLHRGGLDNENNMTLACSECNEKRGHDMPELSEEFL